MEPVDAGRQVEIGVQDECDGHGASGCGRADEVCVFAEYWVECQAVGKQQGVTSKKMT